MKTKQLSMGDSVVVRASEFLGTPAIDAEVSYAFLLDGREYYRVLCADGTSCDVDAEGYVTTFEPSATRWL